MSKHYFTAYEYLGQIMFKSKMIEVINLFNNETILNLIIIKVSLKKLLNRGFILEWNQYL